MKRIHSERIRNSSAGSNCARNNCTRNSRIGSRHIRGIGVVQVIAALALIGVLAGMAWPALANAYARVHLARASMALGDSVLAASRHAVASGVATVLCPADAQGCSGESDWSRGWLLFADLDGDRHFGPGDTLLQRQAASPGDIRLRSNQGRPRIVFQPDGGSAGSNLSFVACSRSGAFGQRLVLSNAGRFRLARAELEQIASCRTDPAP